MKRKLTTKEELLRTMKQQCEYSTTTIGLVRPALDRIMGNNKVSIKTFSRIARGAPLMLTIVACLCKFKDYRMKAVKILETHRNIMGLKMIAKNSRHSDSRLEAVEAIGRLDIWAVGELDTDYYSKSVRKRARKVLSESREHLE